MTNKPLGSRSGRRVHSKSIERRQRILNAAAKALAEHGCAEMKLSHVAQEAGLYAGSLYYYFESREELIQEVLLTSLDWMPEFSATLEDDTAHKSPLDRIIAFVRLVIDKTMAPDDYYLRAYIRNSDQVPNNIRKALQIKRRRLRQTLARLLTEAQAAGHIPAHTDTNVAAQFIIGATSWMATRFEPTDPYSLGRIKETFVGLVLHGVLGMRGTEAPVAPARQANASTRGRQSRRGK